MMSTVTVALITVFAAHLVMWPTAFKTVEAARQLSQDYGQGGPDKLAHAARSRLAAGRAPSSGDSLNSTIRFAISRLGSRPISFWAFKSAAEKYLRIGNPEVLGSYVDGFVTNQGQNQPYTSPLYPSVKRSSNGVYLLQQIGFPSTFYDVSVVYTMIVAKRPEPAVLASFVPIWENVRIYFNQYVQQYLTANNINATFNIPPEVVSGGNGFPGLANLDFATLTGVGELSISKVPAITTNHTDKIPFVCLEPQVFDAAGKQITRQLVDSRRLVPAAPTAVAANDFGCNSLWTKYYIRGDYIPTRTAPFPTWTRNGSTTTFSVNFPGFYELCDKSFVSVIPTLVQLMNAAPADAFEQKAMIFRAYLATGCAGNFNALFSGNGFTFTGTGGVFSGTVHEVLLAQIPNAIDAVFKDKILGDIAYAFFCIDGSKNCCPTAEPNCEMAR
eukprot:gene10624-10782_t